MSHCITELDTVYTPAVGRFNLTWHGLNRHAKGEVIEKDGSNIPNVFSPIITAGFKIDFDSPVSELPADLEDDAATIGEMKDWKMLMADLRGQGKGVIPLHVAKSRYTIHQNKALFDSIVGACRQVLGEDGFEIATVGTLGAYSQFFASISIKGHSSFELKGGDMHELFFNLNSSHNGMMGSSLLLSVIRMVCMNTVQASITDAEAMGTRSAIRHTQGSAELITTEAFAASLGVWTKQIENHKKFLEGAQGVPMNQDGFRAFAAGVFSNEKTDALSTVSHNRIEDMVPLFVKGLGNKGKSLYDGINAFTEYFTSGAGIGGEKVSMAKRVASANFGRGNEWKIEAIRVAGDEKELKAASKRGGILINDRRKATALAS